jgi:hypothetical protein
LKMVEYCLINLHRSAGFDEELATKPMAVDVI